MMTVLKIMLIIVGVIIGGFLLITAFVTSLGRGMSPGNKDSFMRDWIMCMMQFLGM